MHRRARRRRSEAGAVLIEALVAAAIVAIALFFVIGLLAHEARLTARAAGQHDAYVLLEAALEGIRAGAVPLVEGKTTYEDPVPPWLPIPVRRGAVLWIEVTTRRQSARQEPPAGDGDRALPRRARHPFSQRDDADVAAVSARRKAREARPASPSSSSSSPPPCCCSPCCSPATFSTRAGACCTTRCAAPSTPPTSSPPSCCATTCAARRRRAIVALRFEHSELELLTEADGKVVWMRSDDGVLVRQAGGVEHGYVQGVRSFRWRPLGDAVEVWVEYRASSPYLRQLAGSLPKSDPGVDEEIHLVVVTRGGGAAQQW